MYIEIKVGFVLFYNGIICKVLRRFEDKTNFTSEIRKH